MYYPKLFTSLLSFSKVQKHCKLSELACHSSRRSTLMPVNIMVTKNV